MLNVLQWNLLNLNDLIILFHAYKAWNNIINTLNLQLSLNRSAVTNFFKYATIYPFLDH